MEYLGITVDENIKWDTHITNVSLKISRNLGIIGRVKHYLSSRELKLLSVWYFVRPLDGRVGGTATATMRHLNSW